MSWTETCGLRISLRGNFFVNVIKGNGFVLNLILFFIFRLGAMRYTRSLMAVVKARRDCRGSRVWRRERWRWGGSTRVQALCLTLSPSWSLISSPAIPLQGSQSTSQPVRYKARPPRYPAAVITVKNIPPLPLSLCERFPCQRTTQFFPTVL